MPDHGVLRRFKNQKNIHCPIAWRPMRIVSASNDKPMPGESNCNAIMKCIRNRYEDPRKLYPEAGRFSPKIAIQVVR
jgi:hypothetical protein